MSDAITRDFLEAIDNDPALYARLDKPLSWEEIFAIAAEAGFAGVTAVALKQQIGAENDLDRLRLLLRPTQYLFWELEPLQDASPNATNQPELTIKAIRKIELKSQDSLADALGLPALEVGRQVFIERLMPQRPLSLSDRIRQVEVKYVWKASIRPSFRFGCQMAVVSFGERGYRAAFIGGQALPVGASFPADWIDPFYQILTTNATTVFNLPREIGLDGTRYKIELQQEYDRVFRDLKLEFWSPSRGIGLELRKALETVATQVVEKAIQNGVPGIEVEQNHLNELLKHG